MTIEAIIDGKIEWKRADALEVNDELFKLSALLECLANPEVTDADGIDMRLALTNLCQDQVKAIRHAIWPETGSP